MWPFYKTYKIYYLKGRYSRIPTTTYIRATNMANAIKKLRNRDWPTDISVERIEVVEDN